jgi:ADP-heptose:LPS heptosyltransferase
MVLGPVERERWGDRADDLARRLPLLLCPSLATLAGLLAGARAYLGNDSGVSHLSAAVGTATVAIFQEPNQRHFAPRGPKVAIVSAPSLAAISVSHVAEAMEKLFP